VRVSHAGFRPFEGATRVSATGQAKLDVQLGSVEEVTAASRVTESVEDAPSSVTIITGQELRAMGYPTIAEALRGVRGLYVGNDTAYDSVGVRGFSRPGDYGSRVLVLLDGHPLNDNYVGQSYFGYDGRVDLADIDRIEIVRGPGSVVYGTGAFLGVINLVTRGRSGSTHTEAGLTAAGNGVGAARAMQQVTFSPDAGVWTSVSAAHGAGADYYFKEYASDPATRGYSNGNDGFDAGNVTGRAWYRWATLEWYVNSRKKDLPSAVAGGIFGDGRLHYTDTRGTAELRLEPVLAKQIEWLTRAHLDLYNFDDFIPTLVEYGGNETESFRGQWAGIEQRVAYVPNKPLRVTVGGELEEDFKAEQAGVAAGGVSAGVTTPSLQYLLPVNRAFQVGAGYASLDYTPVHAVKVTAGARYDYYSNFGGSVNPRVAVIAKPYDGGVIKAMFGKAFRAPSVYEHYYEGPTQLPGDCRELTPSAACLSQTPLRPESVYSGELELTHHFTPTLSATAAGYTNYITDILTLAGGGTETSPNQYVNLSNPIQTYGGEVEIKRDWRDGWMVGASYSYQDTEYLDNATTQLRNVPNSPHHLAALKGAAPLLGRVLVLASRLTFEGPVWDRYDQPTDPPQTETNPFFIWDVVLSGEAERFGVRYNLGLYNATDQKISLPVSRSFTQDFMPQPGRTVLAQVSFAL
jgi:outer membrane receptor protein involved in Fe transport